MSLRLRKARMVKGDSKAKAPPRGLSSRAEVLNVSSIARYRGCSRSERLLHAAVLAAVSKVNNQAYGEPDDQTRPIYPAQFVHHVAIEDDAQNRHHWDPGGTKR